MNHNDSFIDEPPLAANFQRPTSLHFDQIDGRHDNGRPIHPQPGPQAALYSDGRTSGYSAYSGVREGGVYRARSTQSMTSGRTIASTVKFQAYVDYKRDAQRRKLNKLTLGPGRKPCMNGLLIFVVGFLVTTAGVVVMILQYTKRILVQDKVEFLGPLCVCAGFAILVLSGHFFVKALVKSNRARRKIVFRPSGALSVSAANLAFEPDNTDLISGRHHAVTTRDKRTVEGTPTPLSTLPRAGSTTNFYPFPPSTATTPQYQENTEAVRPQPPAATRPMGHGFSSGASSSYAEKRQQISGVKAPAAAPAQPTLYAKSADVAGPSYHLPATTPATSQQHQGERSTDRRTPRRAELTVPAHQRAQPIQARPFEMPHPSAAAPFAEESHSGPSASYAAAPARLPPIVVVPRRPGPNERLPTLIGRREKAESEV